MRRVRAGGMEGSVPSRGRSFLLKPGTQAPGFNRGDFPLCSLPKQDLWLSCTRASVGFWSFWGNTVIFGCGFYSVKSIGSKAAWRTLRTALSNSFSRRFLQSVSFLPGTSAAFSAGVLFYAEKEALPGRASFLLQGFAYSAIMLPSAHSRNCPGAGWDENCTGVST